MGYIYTEKSFGSFRRALIFKLEAFKKAFYDKLVSEIDERQVKNYVESCQENGYCENIPISEIYKLEEKVKKQLQFIEDNSYRFEIGEKSYTEALKRIWEIFLNFRNAVSTETEINLKELLEYKDFDQFIFGSCLMCY